MISWRSADAEKRLQTVQTVTAKLRKRASANVRKAIMIANDHVSIGDPGTLRAKSSRIDTRTRLVESRCGGSNSLIIPRISLAYLPWPAPVATLLPAACLTKISRR
jgi:hypothetical protein